MIIALSVGAWAWTPLQNQLCPQMAWDSDSHWVVHDQFVGSRRITTTLDDADVIDALEAGFDVWETPTTCCSGFRHVYDGYTTATGYANNDGINAITFEESSWDPSFGSQNVTIAVTITSSNWQCEIPTADQVYNAVGFDFSTANSPSNGQTDLQSIAAHEHGHWLGLGHSASNSATMFASYSGGTGPRSLSADDDDGVCTLYPETCGPPEICDDNVDNDGDGDIDCDDSACATDAACLELSCADGLDDDGDGLVDCADPDCDGQTACVCAVQQTLPCDRQVTGTTLGGTNTVQQWACANWQTDGPEAVYVFTPTESGQATVTLSGLDADLDLFITDAANGVACNPTNCLSEGNPDQSDEIQTVEVEAEVSYIIVADGWEGASSDFTLEVDCPGDAPVPSESDADADADADSDVDTDTDADSDVDTDTDTEPPIEFPVEPCTCRSGRMGSLLGVLLLVPFLTRRRT